MPYRDISKLCRESPHVPGYCVVYLVVGLVAVNSWNGPPYMSLWAAGLLVGLTAEEGLAAMSFYIGLARGLNCS